MLEVEIFIQELSQDLFSKLAPELGGEVPGSQVLSMSKFGVIWAKSCNT